MSNNQPYAGTPASSVQVAQIIERSSLNWNPIVKLFANTSPEELAKSLLSLYFCITDAMTAFPEEISTENLRTDLMQLGILYYAINDMGLHSEAKIG